MSKKYLIISVVVILLLILGFGGWWYYAKLYSKPVVIQQDETASWKTYSNKEYGFEFKYPAAASVTSDSTTVTVKDNNYEFHVLIGNEKLETTRYNVPSGTMFTMTEKKIGSTTWYQDTLDGPIANVEYNYALGSKKLSVLIWQYTDGWDDVLPGGDYNPFINHLFDSNSSQDQILSTFKFIK
jgi:hypothetical protein